MITEQEFYQELGRVPELPNTIYDNIHRRIRRHTIIFRTVLALAATLIIAVGATGILVTRDAGNASVVGLSPEVISELQTIRSYLTGEDLDQQSESYALYEGAMAE